MPVPDPHSLHNGSMQNVNRADGAKREGGQATPCTMAEERL